jgi:uncharacterized protein (TIGR00266 family)
MKCHVVDYRIIGDDMQMVEIGLDPGETVIAEAGTMNFMDDGVSFEAKMGDGSKPTPSFLDKILQAGQRVLTGESFLMTHFTNTSRAVRQVTFAAPYPGKIIPIDLAKTGNEILCQKDAFLCAAFGTGIHIAFTKRLGAGFFGGEGFILQKLTGDGLAFVHACGMVVEKTLNGETLHVDTGCLVAFTKGIEYDIELVRNLKSMFFGGEGLFLATLKGKGKVYLQSLPFSRLADRIVRHAPSLAGNRKEEGSVLGPFGDLIGGR